jgi:hypothetical protein
VYEFVLQMIAHRFVFGHETPGRRQILRTWRRCDADPARLA